VTPSDPRSTWNKLSSDYQSRRANSTVSADYGPWAPAENELRLLGNVRGQRILDLGCGGGQCAVAFARQGALVTGLDISDNQLALARALAYKHGVEIDFVQGSADDLAGFESGAWDIVFSTYTLPYVTDIRRCLVECSRVLTLRGRLVFSLDHPFRDCFVDEVDDALVSYPARNYFDNAKVKWRWNDQHPVVMQSHHFTVAQWIDMLHSSGLRLARLVEPAPPVELLNSLWPTDGALAELRKIPQTIIFVAEKP
jgi:SAM-dependent methyltransferase